MSIENMCEPLSEQDIVPGDFAATLWRWSLRNGWPFVPDMGGGEPWVDPRLAWQLAAPHNEYTSCKNGLLRGVPRRKGLVRLSDVMQVWEGMEEETAAENVKKTSPDSGKPAKRRPK